MAKDKSRQERPGDLRRRAQEVLSRKKTGASPATSEEDILALVHELEVRRSELEIENEELRRANALVEETQNRYFDLFEFAPVAYLTLDANGLVLEANQAIVRRLGAERTRLVGSPLSAYIVMADRNVFLSHLDGILNDNTPRSCEVRFMKKGGGGGGGFDARLDTLFVVDAAGNSQFRIATTDISESKRVTAALRENEERLRLFFQNAVVGAVEIDLEGRVIKVNDRFCQMTGYEEAELLGMHISALLHPEDWNRDYGIMGQYLREGREEYTVEKRYVKKDGKVVWMQIAAKIFKDHDGRPVRSAGIIVEITERKQAEEKLQNALRDSMQRNNEMAALLEAARAVLHFRSFKQAAGAIFDICKKIVGATAGYVALLSQDKTEKEVLFLDAGDLTCTVAPTLPMPIRGLRLEAYSKGEVAYRNEFAGSAFQKLLPEGHVALENVLFAPMVVDGKAAGVIGAANKPGGFNEDDARMAKALGELCSVALRNCHTLEALQQSEQNFRSLVDALPVHTATLDSQGRITLVNGAWKRFAIENGLEDPALAGVGANYLDVCRRAAVAGVASARKALAGLEEIYEDPGAEFSLEYPCHSPEGERWFRMMAAPMDKGANQVVVIHMDITQQRLAQQVLRRDRDQLEELVRKRTAQLSQSNLELNREMEIRRLTEQSLRASEERYRKITSALTDYIYTVRIEGGAPVETIHSPECEVVTGYSCEELAADPHLWLKMVEEGHRDQVLEYANRVLTGANVEPIEHVIVRRDGELRWVRNTAVPHYDPEGNLVSYDGLLRDITEKKAAEEKLRESEEKYREFFERSPLGMFHSNRENKFIDANQSLAAILGYESPQELKSSVRNIPDQAYVHPRKIRSELKRRLSENDWTVLEMEFLRKDRTTGTANLHLWPVRDKQGRVLHMEGLVEDTTARRVAEKQLKESKETLQMLFDGISEPLIMMQDGLVKMINLAAKDYHHVREYGDAIGKPCFVAFYGRSTPCDGCERVFSALMDFSGTFERRGARTPDRLERVTVYSLKNGTGGHSVAIVRISDITEQRLIERQLAQNEKLAAIGLLVSSIAHEINNPNNFIVFNLPILRDYIDAMFSLIDRHDRRMEGGDRLDFFGMPYEEFRQEVFNLLEDMELGSSRINVTVSELKDFSQKRDKLEAIQVDLKLTIERALAMCRSQLMKSVRSLDVDVPEDLPLILTDPKAVEQVLVNVLINASQAADKKDSWIKLRVLQEDGRDGCIIEVSDNGCGLDEQITEKIFEPFFTTKEASHGTGLGLYVCKTLMSALGGRIEVESEHGKGSTFRVVLGDGGRLPKPAA